MKAMRPSGASLEIICVDIGDVEVNHAAYAAPN